MSQQACIAYGGPPAKASLVVALHTVFGICNDPSIQSLPARRGSNAQTQTSYEDTLFPIGFAALKKFKESFHDVNAACVQANAEGTVCDDPSMMPRSVSSITNLVNFEISVPGPSRGDR